MAYEKEAEGLVVATGKIMDVVRTQGLGTTAVMVILGELMRATTTVNFFLDLPQDQKDDFLAQVFDAAIGTEPTALVNQVAFFDAAALEQMSDGLKAGVLAYLNKAVVQPVT